MPGGCGAAEGVIRKHGRDGDRVAEPDRVIDPHRWGLVVVDMQNDFIATGGYYERRTELDQRVARGKLSLEARNRLLSDLNVPHPGEFTCRVPSLLPIVDNICRVIEHARRERRPVVYLKAVYDRTFAVQPPSLRQAPERNHYPCKANSWGAALIEPIGQLVSDGIMDSVEKGIEKHTFDGFHQTELFGFLKSCKVQTVVMVGVETHVCVLATAQSAAVNYFKTIILEDCVWTAQDALGRAALAIFRDAFGSTALLRDHLDSAAFPTPPPVIPNA
jgi:nicotinamidase-related amidase